MPSGEIFKNSRFLPMVEMTRKTPDGMPDKKKMSCTEALFILIL
jgi:hypothetical protein